MCCCKRAVKTAIVRSAQWTAACLQAHTRTAFLASAYAYQLCLMPAGSASSQRSSSNTPLTAEPEVTQHQLAPNDEFLVLGCDGLWDVLSSQRAVELARQKLREHNDPHRCVPWLLVVLLLALLRHACAVFCLCQICV